MAHFAEINEDNIVVRVLLISNEFEENGQDYLANQLGMGGLWIQTSYNANFRGKFAGIGDLYDKEQDIFIPLSIYTPEHIQLEAEVIEEEVAIDE